jgi:tRNA isopentenyl-2-thiomethyl-A-37 hydroxylase MiaE
MKKTIIMVAIMIVFAFPAFGQQSLTLDFALIDYQTAMQKVLIYVGDLDNPNIIEEKDVELVIRLIKDTLAAQDKVLQILKAKEINLTPYISPKIRIADKSNYVRMPLIKPAGPQEK